MAPSCPLPLPKGFSCAEDYVNSLLAFSTSSDTFQTLCGGVHILDFMTRDPDLYSVVLPEAWRTWFCEHKIEDILDLLMREDLTQFEETGDSYENGLEVQEQSYTWRGGSRPPSSLLMYVRDIRRHSLDRTFRKAEPSSIAQGKKGSGLARNVAVGMKPKKVHEVQNFAQYVDHLTIDIGTRSGHKITHLVDFGSGQNYLGRVLASQPYNKHIVAIESKDLNIDGARGMDITAKLTKKENAMRNKKQFRLDEKMPKSSLNSENVSSEPSIPATSLELGREIERRKVDYAVKYTGSGDGTIQYVKHEILDGKLPPVVRHIVNGPNRDIIPSPANGTPNNLRHNVQRHQSDSTFAPSKSTESKLHIVADAVLGSVESVFIGPLNLQLRDTATPGLLVISLHSCGNLLHHGIRSLLLNPLVRGVALIGCCYNLVTERLGPPSLKLPTLRPANARLGRTSSAQDPHGFPMSERLATYSHRHGRGLRLNITARMMAVQAPQNWTSTESEAFFTRHFFRALLQRIFLDRGVVGKPTTAESDVFAGSPAGWSGGTQPIIIGSLRKACYTSFVAYVRGAVAKLIADPEYGISIEEHMAGLMDTEIEKYERTYHAKKKELSIVWSLMAFSAGVVESVIVVDRWLFLKEHEHIVKDCWVEAVFDYKISPRNLAVALVNRLVYHDGRPMRLSSLQFKEAHDRHINLPDESPDEITKMVAYFYTRDFITVATEPLELGLELANMYILADKYQVDDLKRHIVKKLGTIRGLGVDAVQLLMVAERIYGNVPSSDTHFRDAFRRVAPRCLRDINEADRKEIRENISLSGQFAKDVFDAQVDIVINLKNALRKE